jgi:hypothetical protein
MPSGSMFARARSSFAMLLWTLRLGICQAALACVLEIGRASVLAQQITESFIRQLLEAHHAVARKHVEGMASFQIELYSLALRRPLTAAPRPGRCFLHILFSRRTSPTAYDSMEPGLTAFTRMRRAFKSVVHVRANERTAAFVAL